MARTPDTNPFTPGYGVVPQVFAGRNAEFSDFERVLLRRVAQGIYEPARLLTGDRGMGKTALLKQLEVEAEEAGHWVVRASAVRGSAAVSDLLETLARVLDQHGVADRITRSAAAALKRVAGVSVSAAGVTVSAQRSSRPAHDRQHRDLTDILVEAGALARDEGVVLLILVDEAQNIDGAAMGALFHALQEAQGSAVTRQHESGARLRHHPPLAVYVAGLPSLPALLRSAGSTFGERARHLRLGPLSDGDVAEALVAFTGNAGVTVDGVASQRFVELVGGYPYFLHVLGSYVWEAGDGPVVTLADVGEGWRLALVAIDQFYEERLRDLTDLQLRYLEHAARLPADERTSGAIAASLGSGVEAVGSTQQALIDTHVLLRRSGRGKVEFTLPGLDRHLAARGLP